MHPLALIAACLVVFALLALQVFGDGPMAHFDLQVTQWLAAHRQPWLTQAMLWLSEIHRTAGVLIATALAAGWMARRHGRRSALLLGAVPTGMLLNVGLKESFQRLRPVLDEPLVHLSTYSFPSGHGTASTLFYGALFALVLAQQPRPALRAWALAGAAAMVAMVCFSRVYLGAHYLSDVLAAVCVGTAWLLAWQLALRRRGEEHDDR